MEREKEKEVIKSNVGLTESQWCVSFVLRPICVCVCVSLCVSLCLSVSLSLSLSLSHLVRGRGRGRRERQKRRQNKMGLKAGKRELTRTSTVEPILGGPRFSHSFI